MVEQAAGPPSGEPHRRQVTGSRRWASWDVKPVGGGLSETRIQYGPGYRIYFLTRDAELIVLLCRGDKDSQRRDIERAKRMATERRR